ncbi:MAG: single-stranded-DNA-specific exonuclease RecJ [Patescibacteria group bacterium]|nr:single-stranded-DNA-specific exonuclease RecJ [Patescibacteria group bacterium]
MPKWILKEKYTSEFAEKLPGYSPVVWQLLYDRGLDNQEKIDEFFNPDYLSDIHDPFLFKDAKKASKCVLEAIEKQESILVFGDYDADGVTASVVMEKTLRKLGAQNVDVFIPHRELDGYGLNLEKAEELAKEKKYNLIITVDCGITNFEAIEKLNSAGIDTIVTDHHLATEKLPPAFAILNPSVESEIYPFKKLAGVGVAFKLAQALFREKQEKQEKSEKQEKGKKEKKELHSYEAFEKWLLDLVTLGTIGDVSPILGENRTLVTYGLKVLNKTPRKGLQELIRVSSLSDGEELKNLPLGADLYDLNIRNISFQLVPRINAAGRIDHASLALELLSTEDEIEAIALARDIQEKNLQRQKIVEVAMKEAKEILGEVTDDKKILIAASANWPVGIVGLISGKLMDEFARPVILMNQDGENYAGSARSIAEFNITEALGECGEFLERFGGHAKAAGFGIKGKKNYNKFIAKMEALAEEKLKDVELTPTIEIDTEIKFSDLNWELWDEIKKFEPFAEANPLPLFLVKNLKVESVEEMGKNGGHLRFYFSDGALAHKAISFGTAVEWKDKIKSGDIIDAVMEFGINEWNGNRELQFKLVDFKPEGCHPEKA